MPNDPFAYDVDELVSPARGSVRPVIIGLGAMLGIGVLSAMVLIESPMAPGLEVTDEERLARMLALAPAGDSAGEVAETERAVVDTEPESATGLRVRRFAASELDGLDGGTDFGADGMAPFVDASAEAEPLAHATAQAPDRRSDAVPVAALPTGPDDSAMAAMREVSATVEAAAVQPEPTPPETAQPAPAPTVAKPVAPARPAAPRLGQAADGPFAIQFGAMSSRAAAEGEIARMRLATPGLFAGVETTIESTRLDDGREVNRMRIAGVTERADARAWCRAFKAQGGACYVIG